MRVFVAGHRGMVGGAVASQLQKDPDVDLVTAPREKLDLRNQKEVSEFFKAQALDEVIICSAKVGGIFANNTYPAEFIYDNLMIQSNLIHGAFVNGINKLMFLGSSCIYPKEADQPMLESSLLQGSLESTNEPYAVAKIAGIKMCESYNRQYGTDFRCVMPTNLYGPGDNFHPENSHVIAGLMRRFHNAKLEGAENVNVWGTGSPRREFLYIDDLANAVSFFHSLPSEIYYSYVEPMNSHINIGTGEDISIAELASLVKDVVGFDGSILFDPAKPDGTPRKLLNVDKANGMGWTAETDLVSGLNSTYAWYLKNISNIRG